METAFNVDPNQIIAQIADADMTEGVFVAPGAAEGSCQIAGANPAVLLGVNVYNVDAGRGADIVQGGIMRVKAGAAVARGARVTSDATGRAITATPAAAGATYIAEGGIAMDSCAAANEYIAVKLTLGLIIIA